MNKLLWIGVVIGFFLSACVEKRDLKENVLIVHLNVDPKSLHVTNDQTGAKQFIFSITHKPLYQIDLRTMEPIPLLLESMPAVSEDGLNYHFKLKKGVTWDDGSQLTAKDVDFTLKVNLCNFTNNPNVRAVYRGVIESLTLDETDPLAFTVKMRDLHINNPTVFSEMYIIQQALWDPNSIIDGVSYEEIFSDKYEASPSIMAWFNGFNDKKNGTSLDKIAGLGPYKMVEWNDQAIICEKKSNWWGDQDTSLYNKNNPDKIIFRIIQSLDPAINALRRGQIDYTHKMGAASIKRLEHSSFFRENYDYQFVGQFAYSFICLNNKPDGIKQKKIFVDKRVRKAMAHLTPVDEIIEVFLEGNGERQCANVMPAKPYYNTDLKPIEYDIEAAEKLLDETGWKDTDGDHIRDKMIDGVKTPLEFKLSYINAEPYTDMALMIIGSFKKAGVNVIADGKDIQSLIRSAQMHEYDAFIASLIGDAKYDDPSQLWKSESWANHGFNFSGFGNASTDSLIDHINRQTNPENYAKAIKEFQSLLYEELPFIFMYQQNKYVTLHKRFSHDGYYAEKPGAILQGFTLKGSTNKSIE